MVVVVMRRGRLLLLVVVVTFSLLKALKSWGGVGGDYIRLFAYDSTALAQKGDLTKKGEGHVKSTSRFLRFRAGLCQSAFIG